MTLLAFVQDSHSIPPVPRVRFFFFSLLDYHCRWNTKNVLGDLVELHTWLFAGAETFQYRRLKRSEQINHGLALLSLLNHTNKITSTSGPSNPLYPRLVVMQGYHEKVCLPVKYVARCCSLSPHGN